LPNIVAPPNFVKKADIASLETFAMLYACEGLRNEIDPAAGKQAGAVGCLSG
jgi:hypothetical protein